MRRRRLEISSGTSTLKVDHASMSTQLCTASYGRVPANSSRSIGRIRHLELFCQLFVVYVRLLAAGLFGSMRVNITHSRRSCLTTCRAVERFAQRPRLEPLYGLLTLNDHGRPSLFVACSLTVKQFKLASLLPKLTLQKLSELSCFTLGPRDRTSSDLT